MNPLDLLKVKFQVSTRGPEGGVGRGIWRALRDIHASEGWRGLYRGLGPNVAGNASSWGLYFLLCVLSSVSLARKSENLRIYSYNQLKRRATFDAPDRPLSASQYLLFSAEASSHIFSSTLVSLRGIMTSLFLNIYRCHDSHPYKPNMGGEGADIYRVAQLACGAPWALECVRRLFFVFSLTGVGLAGGFRAIFRDEGLRGLYRGTSLALVGVSNGALQFMGYEKMKNWGFERKRRRVAKLGRAWTTDDDKLVRLFISRCAKSVS